MTGEHLSSDIQAFIRLLNRHGVRYLLVGGEAVIHHGYARLTGDVDLFYDATPANARRLFDALLDFWGGDVPAVSGPDDLLEPDVVVQFGRPPNRIDLISTLGSVDFAAAWRRRVIEKLRVSPRATSNISRRSGVVQGPRAGASGARRDSASTGRSVDDSVPHATPRA